LKPSLLNQKNLKMKLELESKLKDKKPFVKKKDRVSLTASRHKDLKNKTLAAKSKRK